MNDEIRMEAVEPKYYQRMPHIADDTLDPYEYKLYGHYRRVAGEDGACWESTTTTAERTQMSKNKMLATRKSLAKKGFIRVTVRANKNKDHDTTLIQVVNIWERNIAHVEGGGSSPHAQPLVHDMHNPSASDAPKEEPSKEEPSKEILSGKPETDASPAKVEANRRFDLAHVFAEYSTDKSLNAEEHRQGILRFLGRNGKGVIGKFADEYEDVEPEEFREFLASYQEDSIKMERSDTLIRRLAMWRLSQTGKDWTACQEWTDLHQACADAMRLEPKQYHLVMDMERGNMWARIVSEKNSSHMQKWLPSIEKREQAIAEAKEHVS